MTFTQEQVEWIVAEVLRRLGVADSVAVAERSSATAELVVNEKVVTMRTIEGRLAGVQRLVLPPRAIVTPAVRDELKKHQVELSWQTGMSAPRT